jgi:hypothetical protein
MIITPQITMTAIIVAAKSSSLGGLLAFIAPYSPSEHDRPKQDQKHGQQINKEILRFGFTAMSHRQCEIKNASQIQIECQLAHSPTAVR